MQTYTYTHVHTVKKCPLGLDLPKASCKMSLPALRIKSPLSKFCWDWSSAQAWGWRRGVLRDAWHLGARAVGGAARQSVGARQDEAPR